MYIYPADSHEANKIGGQFPPAITSDPVITFGQPCLPALALENDREWSHSATIAFLDRVDDKMCDGTLSVMVFASISQWLSGSPSQIRM